MLTQPAKVIISFLLSFLALFLYVRFKNRERKLCMFAMFSSTVGDIFMTDILQIGSSSTYFGAFFFILAHCVYAICFIKASYQKNYHLFNVGMIVGICVSIIAILSLYILMINVTGSIQSMFIPLIGYMLFISINLVCQFSYAYSEKGKRRFLYLGMLLFLVSDFLVFMPMLNIVVETQTFNDYIWFTYIPAQILIILFNSDFKCTC